ncbi:MAG: Hpt domain-containing protein [Pirellulaceae bacterium]|nr:Hpt domain-containing protein [Pirellulaceae bacterium]MDP6557325.1 Hpt domain-containing protein [Pirellulaceae bacterium]MDP6721116.1 Hpt domain-containing protein [Pirellulaceae bacterium]
MTIDWDVALGIVDGRQDLLLELIDIFFAESAEIMPRIAAAIDNGDAGELQLFAHRLKGCLGYFGQSKAGEIAWQLESLGRVHTLDDAPQLLAQLQIAVDELLPPLRAYRQEHQQP